MNNFQNIPLDLFNLLLFTMPGFFFVWAFSKNKKTDFEYLMFSMFWGILLMTLFYHVLPTEKFTPLLQNPYAGAVSLLITAMVIGSIPKIIKFLKSFI
ncbi:MAG: hypothetical protein NTX96_03300 [Candidatus Zambryskibacteria bacterium]|nr:hypothetical protein [Candidatus Zambryskibacteria bacterium]